MGQRFSHLAIIFALMMLPACTVYGEHPVKSFNDATGGEGLERSFWHDIQRQDWKDLEQHLAGNFVYVTPGGRWDREAALEQFRQLQLQEYSIGELSTEMNRDAFVVTYTITLHGTFKGQALPAQPLRCMTVWQQQKRGWVVIAQSSPIS
ncbi:MAG TPA: nuclear transport factor 2 family protein [Terriglobales bacterium]|nr:nuclear transport factor 2 family protein [Terriglobales bacterium]